jgi:hypothetical protein
MPDRAWQELVAEGRRLDKREGNLRWEWGDWALKVAPLGLTTANTGRYDRLQKAMDEAGIQSVAFHTVRDYAAVAAAWPPAERSAASWMTHQILTSHPERFALIRDGMTIREAQKVAGRKVTVSGGGPEASPDERVAKVREYLKDPDVVQAIAADNEAAGVLWKAGGEVRREWERETKKDDRRKAPQASREAEYFQVAGMLDDARYRLGKALAAMRDADLSDTQRTDLRERVREVENTLGWIVSFLESGSRNFDEGLRELLAQGGGQ